MVGGGYVYVDDLSIWEIGPTPVGVSESAANKAGVSVYPNPANNSFTVKASGEGIATLYSLTGGTIATNTLNNGITEFTTQNLSSGIYFVKVQLENGFVENLKVIVNKQ